MNAIPDPVLRRNRPGSAIEDFLSPDVNRVVVRGKLFDDDDEAFYLISPTLKRIRICQSPRSRDEWIEQLSLARTPSLLTGKHLRQLLGNSRSSYNTRIQRSHRRGACQGLQGV